jgi:hypothetical protein
MKKSLLREYVHAIVKEEVFRKQIQWLFEGTAMNDPAAVANKMKDLYNEIWSTDVFTVQQDGRTFYIMGPKTVPVNGRVPDTGSNEPGNSRRPNKDGEEYLDVTSTIQRVNKGRVIQTLKSILPSSMRMELGGAGSIVFKKFIQDPKNPNNWFRCSEVGWNWYMASSRGYWGWVEGHKDGTMEGPAPVVAATPAAPAV